MTTIPSMINDTINDLEMMGIQVQSFILQVSDNDYPVCQPKCGNVFACHTLCENKTNTTHSHDEERKRELETERKKVAGCRWRISATS